MTRKLRTEQGRATYALRSQTVEHRSLAKSKASWAAGDFSGAAWRQSSQNACCRYISVFFLSRSVCLKASRLSRLVAINQVFFTEIQIETQPFFVMDVILVGKIVGEKTLLGTGQQCCGDWNHDGLAKSQNPQSHIL